MEVTISPDWVNTFIALGTFGTMALSLLIGYLFRLAKDLSEYKTYVAKTYATKSELNQVCDRMERKLDRVYDLLQKQNAA
ncbi:hypothetical protein C1M56_03010 [Vibrio diazotrophicus]|nr:hypothetical protein C1M56_03010 [Vibrio diazotrophicus]